MEMVQMERITNLEMPAELKLTLRMGKLMSDEAFFQFCQMNDPLDFERDSQGNITIMSPAGAFTGNFNAKISGYLFLWNLKNQLGEAFDSSAGFTLPNGAVRSPDASWISNERWNPVADQEKEKFPRICPEFVAEVRSKRDTIKSLMTKMEEYQQNGVKLGWLIDRLDNKVYIYKQHVPVKILNSVMVTLSGEDVLPGFELNLADILK